MDQEKGRPAENRAAFRRWIPILGDDIIHTFKCLRVDNAITLRMRSGRCAPDMTMVETVFLAICRSLIIGSAISASSKQLRIIKFRTNEASREPLLEELHLCSLLVPRRWQGFEQLIELERTRLVPSQDCLNDIWSEQGKPNNDYGSLSSHR